MSALRDEIRAILREEFAALRAEQMGPERETVRISCSADLNRFARELVSRAGDPGFADRLARGEIVFELMQETIYSPPVVANAGRVAADVVDKPLITERDIAALGNSARTLRIANFSRLTPLARDEARRRGIRIERVGT